MTIVVSVRVNDGVVLAADSATSFSDQQGNVVKVYNSANKVFNLVKVWPIGAMTYGAGSIGPASIGTLSKDLRKKLHPASGDDVYTLDPNNFTIEEVATKARRFFFDECYHAAYPQGLPNYYLGYRVCGYSSGAPLPEVWEFLIIGNDCAAPVSLYTQTTFGPRWAGDTEALDRLILGCGNGAAAALQRAGRDEADANAITMELYRNLYANLFLPAMPIQDAIDLTYFLAETAAKFSQFSVSAATVGGAIDVATITKHEGFKWIIRKHYYDEQYNRPL